MQKWMITGGIVILVGISGISADQISSSIATDGTAWISSAVVGDQSYSGLLFMNDPSIVVRELDLSGDLQTLTQINSSGPLGVYEFSSREWKDTPSGLLCLFTPGTANQTRYDEISTLGLLKDGVYVSVRKAGTDKTVAFTDINATGMVSLTKRTEHRNQTQRERSFIAGRMNVSEAVVYGFGL